jgi:hypothetical protein
MMAVNEAGGRPGPPRCDATRGGSQAKKRENASKGGITPRFRFVNGK